MMVKYRVHEVAKDLEVGNKEVLDILGKYVKEPKKHMTALEENELNIVFDKFTQDHSVENFDAYFAARDKAAEPAAPAAQPQQKNAKPQQDKKPQQNGKPAEGQKRQNPQNDRNNKNPQNQKNDRKPAPQNNAPKNNAPAQAAVPVDAPIEDTKTPNRRVVDTRTVNVNIDKYN